MNRLFLTCLLFIFAAGSASGQVCDTLTVTGPPMSPPSSWLVNGQLKGASVEFIEILAKQAGVKKVVFKPYQTWFEALEATRLGDVDLLLSTSRSSSRIRYLYFIAPPYASQYLYAVVRKGETFSLSKYQDLIGRKGAMVDGETFGQSQFGVFVENDLKLEKTRTLNDAFNLLLAKKVDYLLAYENETYNEVYSKDLFSQVDVLSTFPFLVETFFAFSKRSQCYSALAAPLSAAIIKDRAQKNSYFHLFNKYSIMFNSTN